MGLRHRRCGRCGLRHRGRHGSSAADDRRRIAAPAGHRPAARRGRPAHRCGGHPGQPEQERCGGQRGRRTVQARGNPAERARPREGAAPGCRPGRPLPGRRARDGAPSDRSPRPARSGPLGAVRWRPADGLRRSRTPLGLRSSRRGDLPTDAARRLRRPDQRRRLRRLRQRTGLQRSNHQRRNGHEWHGLGLGSGRPHAAKAFARRGRSQARSSTQPVSVTEPCGIRTAPYSRIQSWHRGPRAAPPR